MGASDMSSLGSRERDTASDESQRRAHLHAAIAACAQRFAENEDLYEIIKSAVDIIRDHIGLDRVGIYLYDQDAASFTGAFGTDEEGALRDERSIPIPDDPRMPIRRALAGDGGEFFIEDFENTFPHDAFMRGVKNNFFVVLRARGRMLGAVSVDNKLSGRTIDEQTREDLRRFCRYISLALENYRLRQNIEEKNRILTEQLESRSRLIRAIDRNTRLHAAIAACAQRFAETRDLREILKSSLTIISEYMGVDRVGVFLYEEEAHRFLGVYGTDGMGRIREESSHQIDLSADNAASLAVASERGEYFTANYDERFPHEERMRGVKHHFFIVLRAHGRILGGLGVDNLLSQREITVETREDLRRFARYIALALENFLLHENLSEKNRALSRELQRSTKLLADLDRANAELRDFAYIVSHDLKAPLRGISSLAQWVTEDHADQLDKEGKEKLRLLNERTRRMHALIEGILAYSRIGTQAVNRARLDTTRIVQRVLDTLVVPDGVSVRVVSPLPEVFYDEVQLEQVFQNLIENAVAHVNPSCGEIWVGVSERDGAWLFSVRDNGPGIERKHFERIFRVFQRLSSDRAPESTGIGLSIVKKIVEANGGEVGVESEVGKGSAFYFTVPRGNDAEAGPLAEPARSGSLSSNGVPTGDACSSE